MKATQKIVFDYLVFFAEAENRSLMDVTRDIGNKAPQKVNEAYEKLTDLEQDQVIYQAAIEYRAEELF